MKTIALFVRTISNDGYPFNVRDLYFYSYQEYLLAFKKAGMQAYFVTNNQSYKGNGVFTEGYTIDQVSEVAAFTKVENIKVDMVFNKADFEGSDITVVTDRRLHDLLGNKINMYNLLSDYQPQSYICHSLQEVLEAAQKIETQKVVVKGPTGNGGKRVYIYDSAAAVTVPEHETCPLLVQEFMDLSGGIPGAAAGIHDLRILLTGSTVIGATLRQPAEGKYHANVSQGGSEMLVAYADIPAEVVTLAKEIDAKLDQLPRYYAIDFAKTSKGWKLVELNEQPGLFRKSTGPLAETFMDALAQYFVHL